MSEVITDSNTRHIQERLIERSAQWCHAYTQTKEQYPYLNIVLFGFAYEEAARTNPVEGNEKKWVKGAQFLLSKHSLGVEEAHFYEDRFSECHKLDFEEMLEAAAPSRYACGLRGILFAKMVAEKQIYLLEEKVTNHVKIQNGSFVLL